jgi:flagellar assembly protein FliH
LPRVLYKPALESAVFHLRAPAPPAPVDEDALPIYSERDLAGAVAQAEERGRAAARADLAGLRAEIEAQGRREAAGLLAAAKSLRGERAALLTEATEGVVELAFAIARTVLRREVEADPLAVVPLVRELLQRSASAGGLVVRLAPRDHEAIARHLTALPEAKGMEGLRLRSDPQITPGGCLVEAEEGRLDGRIETQLERIEAALRKKEPEFHEERRPAPLEGGGDPEEAV